MREKITKTSRAFSAGRKAKHAGRTRLGAAVAFVAASMLGGLPSRSSAATVYFDGNGAGAASGGPGIWDTTLQRWATSPGGTTYTNFTNGDTAVFQGTGGTVNFGGSVSGSMDIQSNGYLFLGTATVASAPWTWAGSMSLNVATGVSAELHAAATGSVLTKTGAGTLVFDSSLLADAATLYLTAGTLRYGRSNVVASVGSFPSGPTGTNINNSVMLNMTAGTTLDFGGHFHDAVGSLNGSGTIILGAQEYSPGLVTSAPNYTYGSTLVINGGNATTTGSATQPPSTFSGNIISNTINPNLPFSSGHLHIGTVAAITGATPLPQAVVTLSGNNIFKGVVTVGGGATLYVDGGNAIPNDAPVFVTANNTYEPAFILNADETIGSLNAQGANSVRAFVVPNGHTLTLGGDNLNADFSTGGAASSLSGGIGSSGLPGVDSGGSIVKIGTGTQLIWTHQNSGALANTYTGKYRIEGGILGFPSDNAIGAVPGTPVDDYFILNGGTLAQSFQLSASQIFNANRGITVTDKDSGLYGQNGSNNIFWDVRGKITTDAGFVNTPGGLKKTGQAILRLNGGADNSGFKGKWTITDGALYAGLGFGAAVDLGDKPMGSGSVEVSGAVLQLTSDFVSTSTNQTMNLAGNGVFTYDSGAVLSVKRGNLATDFNNSLTVTVGAPSAPTNTAFARKSGGSGALLVLADSGATSLGTLEKVVVNNGVATEAVAGGATVVPSVIVSTNNATTTEGYFATYDATNGLQVLAPTRTDDIQLAASNDIYGATNLSTNNVMATGVDQTVYGLKVGTGGNVAATTVDLNGQTLHVGGPTNANPGIVIMGMNSTITTSVPGGKLDFGAHEGVIFTEFASATDAVSAKFAGTLTGSGGLTKMGYGTLNLDPTAVLNYTGTTRINQGTLQINADNQLPSTTDVIMAGSDQQNSYGKGATLNVNGKTLTINSLNSVNEKNYNAAANAVSIQLGTTGVLKIVGSGSSVFDGQITTTNSNNVATATVGASSTVWMAGPGTLQLGFGAKAIDNHFDEVFNNYRKLKITDGGTVMVGAPILANTINSTTLPISAATSTDVVSDAIMLDGGTLKFVGLGGSVSGGVLGSSTSALPSIAVISNNRGITVGSNGGTINVENPYLQISMAPSVVGASIFAGTGTLTKTGKGMLAIPNSSNSASINNTAQRWKLVVKEGVVTLSGTGTAGGANVDDFLGAAPATLDPTNIMLDGGYLDANSGGTVTLSATRGIFIGPAGGAFGTGRAAMIINGPLGGSGTLTLGGSTPVNSTPFNASADGSIAGSIPFTGNVILARSGAVYAGATNAFGNGNISNDGTWPVVFGTGTATPVSIANSITVNAGMPFEFSINNANADFTINGKISGPGNMYKGSNTAFGSGGMLELNNAANDFTGSFTVTQGSLVPDVDGALGANGANLVVMGTGSLAFKTNVNYTGAKPTFIAGSGLAASGAIQNITGNNTYAGPITLLGPATIKATAGSLGLSGGITGAADSALTTSGAGTLTVKNIRTGGLNVTAGVTQIAHQADPANVSSLAGTSKVGALTITSGAKLDLTNNKLITSSAVGTWDGVSAYTGVTGSIASGRNGGGWAGTTGIITSESNATSGNYTSIGVAKASDIKPATATATDLWAGQTITGTDTLVMYTYGGDANLDGKINVDDYIKIDSGIAAGLTGWVNGDFNYDGKVNIDDYTTVIDANIGTQGAAFSTASGFAGNTAGSLLSGVSAVPEPTSLALVSLGAMSMLTRRRRHRQN